MGHSFGGTFAQLLVGNGLGSAGVSIDGAAVKGINVCRCRRSARCCRSWTTRPTSTGLRCLPPSSSTTRSPTPRTTRSPRPPTTVTRRPHRPRSSSRAASPRSPRTRRPRSTSPTTTGPRCCSSPAAATTSCRRSSSGTTTRRTPSTPPPSPRTRCSPAGTTSPAGTRLGSRRRLRPRLGPRPGRGRAWLPAPAQRPRHLVVRYAAPGARCRLMTRRWIWLVPSKICMTLVSRMYRSTGKSVV